MDGHHMVASSIYYNITNRKGNMISLAEYAAMGVKVTVDTKVRKTRGCRTFFNRSKGSKGFIGSSKPIGISTMFGRSAG